jgi:hypothetical protein
LPGCWVLQVEAGRDNAQVQVSALLQSDADGSPERCRFDSFGIHPMCGKESVSERRVSIAILPMREGASWMCLKCV